jgi:hypothetical protein
MNYRGLGFALLPACLPACLLLKDELRFHALEVVRKHFFPAFGISGGCRTGVLLRNF